jgi:hypothetical protein
MLVKSFAILRFVPARTRPKMNRSKITTLTVERTVNEEMRRCNEVFPVEKIDRRTESTPMSDGATRD